MSEVKTMSDVGYPGSINSDFGSELYSPPEESRNHVDISSVQIQKVDAACWEGFAATYADVSMEQTDSFSAARWGADRLEHNLIVENGEIIAGAVVILVKLPILNRGIAIVKWGPLWRPLNEQPDPIRLYKSVAALRREYAEKRGFFLTMMPAANPEYGQTMTAAFMELGFHADQQLNSPDRYLVNVSLAQDELRASLDQKWRYNLKKSEKNDFRIELVDTDQGLSEFMDLYSKMLERKGFHDTSAIDTLPTLLENNETSLAPKIILVYHEDKPTAGGVIDISGDSAVYLYGATDDRALHLKAGFAMHWWIAEWLCGMPQINWYDLGGADADSGLHQFKKGFVGKQGEIVVTPPAYVYSGSVVTEFLGRTIFALNKVKGTASRKIHRARAAMSV